MLETYTPDDFNKVKFHKLNSDQILVFLGSPKFVNTAKMEKVVDALHHLWRCKELNWSAGSGNTAEVGERNKRLVYK
jgi:hypothetical protein